MARHMHADPVEDFVTMTGHQIPWITNVDEAMSRARSEKRTLLLDFTAAPA